jgi:hypothetical protein
MPTANGLPPSSFARISFSHSVVAAPSGCVSVV